MRNKLMAENADGLIAVWDGGSRGTLNMLDTALQLGLRIFLLRTDLALFWEAPASGVREEAWEFAEERAAIMEFAGDLDTQQAELQAGLEARQRYAPPTINGDEK
ncbi:hypothetical protein [Zoogloea sp.]|uniref:hypothetical protein n=1 Tax=Zoogloea sp. TaxID=49181 RepID=UPI0031FCB9C4